MTNSISRPLRSAATLIALVLLAACTATSAQARQSPIAHSSLFALGDLPPINGELVGNTAVDGDSLYSMEPPAGHAINRPNVLYQRSISTGSSRVIFTPRGTEVLLLVSAGGGRVAFSTTAFRILSHKSGRSQITSKVYSMNAADQAPTLIDKRVLIITHKKHVERRGLKKRIFTTTSQCGQEVDLGNVSETGQLFDAVATAKCSSPHSQTNVYSIYPDTPGAAPITVPIARKADGVLLSFNRVFAVSNYGGTYTSTDTTTGAVQTYDVKGSGTQVVTDATGRTAILYFKPADKHFVEKREVDFFAPGSSTAVGSIPLGQSGVHTLFFCSSSVLDVVSTEKGSTLIDRDFSGNVIRTIAGPSQKALLAGQCVGNHATLAFDGSISPSVLQYDL